MDVVYALGSGSGWDNTEIRYSLRSLQKYFTPLDNVYIIGTRPEWLRNVIHIPAYDQAGLSNKERNIYNKILLACKLPALSQDFLFINDDHFILDPLPPLPYYYQRSLDATVELRKTHDSYYHSLTNTLEVLQQRGLQTFNYDIHAPIIYNKKKFIEVNAAYDWSVNYGYVIKSLYCNSVGVQGTVDMDMKLRARHSCEQLEKILKGRRYFSIDDTAIWPELTTYLSYLYPKKSKYEL